MSDFKYNKKFSKPNDTKDIAAERPHSSRDMLSYDDSNREGHRQRLDVNYVGRYTQVGLGAPQRYS